LSGRGKWKRRWYHPIRAWGDGKGVEERFNGGDRPLFSPFIIMCTSEKEREMAIAFGGIRGSKPAARVKTWLPCVDRGTQLSVGFKVPSGEVKST